MKNEGNKANLYKDDEYDFRLTPKFTERHKKGIVYSISLAVFTTFGILTMLFNMGTGFLIGVATGVVMVFVVWANARSF